MLNNLRSRIILERDYSIGSRQSGISGRWKENRKGLKLEANLDGSATETSGNGITLSPLNMAYVDTEIDYQSKYGSFNWTSASIGIPNSARSWFTEFSVSAWVYPTASASAQKQIVYLGGSWIWTQACKSFQLCWNSNNNTAKFWTQALMGSTWQQAEDQNASSINSWYFLVARYKSWTLELFKNNVLVATKTFTNSSWTDNTFSAIGAYADHSNVKSQFFPWRIQGVKLHDVFLTEKEIDFLYKKGRKLIH